MPQACMSDLVKVGDMHHCKQAQQSTPLLHASLLYVCGCTHIVHYLHTYISCPELMQSVRALTLAFVTHGHSLQLVIVPVNDAPLLSFLTGGSQELYSYNEDDPAISIGLNLTLMDIDSPIESVSLLITSEVLTLMYIRTYINRCLYYWDGDFVQDLHTSQSMDGTHVSLANACMSVSLHIPIEVNSPY